MTKNYLLITLLSYSALTFGQTNLFPASGNVGIGTPSPVSKLSIGDYFVDGSGSNISRDILTSQNTYNNQVVAAHTIEHNLYNNYNTKYHISTLNLTGALTKRLTISGEGNLGIGTTSPQGRLQILKSNLFSDNSSTKTSIDNLLILQSPYVGTDPALYNGTGYKWGIQLWGRNDLPTLDASKAAAIYAVSEDGELGYNRAIGLALHTSPFDGVNVERLRISSKGDVGIGTIDTKGYKLAVAGNMIAESVKVQLKSAWPDYVFKEDYKLTSLQETEKHIKEKGHLPGIPSAADVKSEGIDLGEMNKKLLQKIEELTLYLIQKDHQNELLNKRIEKLEQAAEKR